MQPVVNVFLSVAGQNDNLGDSVLRRGFLDAFRQPSVNQIHVHVGRNDDDYLSAVGLSGNEVVHRSTDSWSAALDRSVLRRRTVLGFNAGEVDVTAARAHLGWRTFARLRLARLRGGSGVHAGVGIRHPGQGSTRALRAALGACAVVSWRDEPSRDATEIGIVAPDWAFGEHTGRDGGIWRDRIVVSMRGDRDFPNSGWLDGVRTLASATESSMTVFSQVRRDNNRTREIAAALGGGTEALLWESGSHAEWERVARELYSGTQAVISDRLHALVIGATQGAVPLGLTVGSPEKLQRTLGTVGLGAFAFAFDSGDDDVHARLSALSRRGDEIAHAVDNAQTRLAVLRNSIATQLV